MNRKVLVGILAAVILAASWHVYRWLPHHAQAQTQAEVDAQRNSAVVKARKRDYDSAVAKAKSLPTAAPVVITEDERFPLGADAKFLVEAPTREPGATRAPLVFLAPLYGATSDMHQTSATETLQEFLRFYLSGAPRNGLALNLVPFYHVIAPYLKVGENENHLGLKPEVYYHDAQLLDCDTFIYGRADEDAKGNFILHLAMSDLHTSRTDLFTQTVPHEQLSALLTAAVGKCAAFCGIAPAIVSQAMIDDSPPSYAAYQKRLAMADMNAADLKSVVAAFPDCRALAWAAIRNAPEGEDSVAIANDALHRWPDDPRMLRAKIQALMRTRNSSASHLIASELARRYSDAIWLTDDFVQSAFTTGRTFGTVGEFLAVLKAADELFTRQCDEYPNYWPLHWTHATFLATMANLTPYFIEVEAKSAKATSKAELEKIGAKYDDPTSRILLEIGQAAERRPDCTALLLNRLKYEMSAGESNTELNFSILSQLNKLDPQTVEPDILVASAMTNSEGRVDILRKAIDRVNREPKAMLAIANSLIYPMGEKMGWGTADQHPDALKQIPETSLFIEAASAAIDADEPVGAGVINMLYHASLAMGTKDTDGQKAMDYLSRNYSRAMAANDKKDWATCLYYARITYGLYNDDREVAMRYCVVRSLFRLHRYRESISFCEESIARFPQSALLHFMFANVCSEWGERLEEGYEHAKIAATLNPSNGDMQVVFKKLAKRLGKSDKL